MVFLSHTTYWGMEVKGPPEAVSRFVEAVRSTATPFDFQRIIPVPNDQPKEYRYTMPNAERHQYAKAWGSSNALDIHIKRDYNDPCNISWTVLDGDCWPILERLAADYPELTFDGSVADDDDRTYVAFISRGGELMTEEKDYDQEMGEGEYAEEEATA